MPFISLPSDLQDGVDVAFGSDVLANDEAIRSVVNGALADDNISPSANIKGSKLSSTPGERIPTDRIEDDSVTDAKLRDAALDADDALRSVTGAHIRNLTITKNKLSTSVGQRVTLAQMDMTVQEVSFTVSLPDSSLIDLWSATVVRDTSGANYQAFVDVVGSAFGLLDVTLGVSARFGGSRSAAVVPGTAIPTATSNLIGLYLADVVISGTGVVSGKVVFVSIAKI